MKTTKTTTATRERAENLSRFLFGKITTVCHYRIQESEEDTQSWIAAIEKKYNVKAY